MSQRKTLRVLHRTVLYLENVSGGGGGGTEVPRNKGGGGAWNPTVLSDLCNNN